MSDQNKNLPSPVRGLLDANLKNIAAPPPCDLHAVFAERINYCRQFDQTKMPPWKDPRG
jgi:hypothetical protein